MSKPEETVVQPAEPSAELGGVVALAMIADMRDLEERGKLLSEEVSKRTPAPEPLDE